MANVFAPEMMFRKSDVRKKGKTRGWEMMLSYSFKAGITTGYVKGTPSSDIAISLQALQECCREVGHPLVLPMIILANDMSVTAALLGMSTVAALHFSLSRLRMRWPVVGMLTEGTSVVVYADGAFDDNQMSQAIVTHLLSTLHN